jgi:hypothetical protein
VRRLGAAFVSINQRELRLEKIFFPSGDDFP